MVPEVLYHPKFAAQYESLCESEALELAGEVTQLLDALEQYGHQIEGEADDDPSHPVVSSRLRMYALRRTPPTVYTPYANQPPIIRVLYTWFNNQGTGTEIAVVMLMGDKTTLKNHWYPPKVTEIETVLAPEWEHHHPTHKPQVKRTR